MAIREDEFRQALGSWPSGVTIVTTSVGNRIHGMTVSDFSGASLSPPLISICCDLQSITTGMIAEAGCFGVNVLTHDQRDLSERFASKKYEHVRFEGTEYELADSGVPMLVGAAVKLDCSVAASHQIGDHQLYIGQIESSEVATTEPLLYWNGAYRSFVRMAEDD